jgi:Gluconate 2-dehydrogenase subunit 3
LEIARRSFLKAAGALGVLALVPAERLRALAATAPTPGRPGRFLTAHEMTTLRAVTARLIPGPPDDPDPGALEAGVAEAIDLLLAAFTFKPPLIHAGGPYSGRHGGGDDDFARFVRLDRHAELGWRIRIEGTRGIKAREFAGPVDGLQTIYRSGLAHLDARARRLFHTDFASVPAPGQDLLLSDETDGDTQAFVGAALAMSLEAMYGPPEYGGNRHLVGWTYTDWPGDLQPRGSTRAEVTQPGPETARLGPAAVAFARLLLPAMAGRPASRDAFWLARAGWARS